MREKHRNPVLKNADCLVCPLGPGYFRSGLPGKTGLTGGGSACVCVEKMIQAVIDGFALHRNYGHEQC